MQRFPVMASGILAEAVERDLPYEIKCPALLICGEQDHAGSCVRYNKAWHKNTGIPLEWIKDAGHNSNTDQPKTVNRLIEKFANARAVPMISAENDLKNQSPIVGKTYVCDRDMIRKERIVLKTALATFVLLLFFFTQGAIVVIMGIDGVPSALIRGAVIWGLVAITLAYSIIRYKGISKLGFRSAEKGAAKRMLYFSPLLLIALFHFAAGIDWKVGAAFLFANLFLTLGIGMAEEIFFRGIICGLWLKHGTVKAMMISSILFGLSHILNIAGAARSLGRRFFKSASRWFTEWYLP